MLMETLRNTFIQYIQIDREKKRQYFHLAYQEIADQNLNYLQLASLSTVLLLLAFFYLTPYIIVDWTMTLQHILFLPASALFFIISVSYAKKGHRNSRIISVLCVIYVIVELSFILAIDIFTRPDAPGSFFPPISVALPALFILPLKLSYLLLFLFETMYVILSFSYKIYAVAQYDVFASIVGIAFSVVVVQTILHLRASDFDIRLKYQQLSQQDFLAGILNKQAFEEAGRGFLNANGSSASCALMILDLDNFKSINDTLGHYAGDQLLREIGNFLPDLFRPSDIIGRFGGDEFVILINGSITPVIFEKKCQLIQQKLYSINLPGLKTGITCSIGGAISQAETVTYDDLFIKADNALYTAKKMGKNCFHLH